MWDRDNLGLCEVTNISGSNSVTSLRKLDEYEIFIRQNQAIEIVKKIENLDYDKKLSDRVYSRMPFGISSTYVPKESGIPCHFIQRIGLKFVDPEDLSDPFEILNKWKFLVPKAPIAGQTDFSRPVGFYYEGNTRIAKPGECCSESWLVTGAFDSKEEVISYKSYLFTKIVRFLLLQTVLSQNISKKNYCFIPDLMHYEGVYSDKILRDMELSDKEWEYIDSKITSVGGDA